MKNDANVALSLNWKNIARRQEQVNSPIIPLNLALIVTSDQLDYTYSRVICELAIVREYNSALHHDVKQMHSTGFYRLTEMLIG